MHNLTLLEKKSVITVKEIKTRYRGLCFAVDFHVQNAEKGVLVSHGLVYAGIVNIDHHAPIPAMRERISSAVLARRYVQNHGTVKTRMFINHTDADSMLSVMMLGEYLPPEMKFAEAAIAADHYGTADPIAEFFQALERLRDPDYSATQFLKYLNGEKLDQRTEGLLEKRKREREQVGDIALNYFKDIAYVTLDKKVDAALFLPHIQDAAAIVIATPMNGKWNVNVRLGNSDAALNELGLPDFGGRWNAGSTGRSGGTKYNAEEYAKILYEKMRS